ncbi:MAG: hypothetical protein HS109_02360 [Burkholderiales bacterium]|nr:hypothetical protein [Burkholderiales bacterium]
MSFSIEKQGDGLLIRVVNATRSEQDVFDRVCACRSTSWWSCPSGECAKIGDCATRRDGDATVLALVPRPGEALSQAGIEECLRYVLAESSRVATGDPAPPAR